MLEIVPFHPSHLANLNLQGFAGEMAKDPETVAALDKSGMAWSGLMDGRVVGCAGLIPQWPGRAVAWAVFGECLPMSAWFKITKAVRKVLAETQASGFHRIEMTVQEDFKQGHRWAEALGFNPVCVLRKYGPEGADHRLWERVA